MNEAQRETLRAAVRLLDDEKRGAYWMSRARAIRPCQGAVSLLSDELEQGLSADDLGMSAEAFGLIIWHDLAEVFLL